MRTFIIPILGFFSIEFINEICLVDIVKIISQIVIAIFSLIYLCIKIRNSIRRENRETKEFINKLNNKFYEKNKPDNN
jgi:hypothetical protein